MFMTDSPKYGLGNVVPFTVPTTTPLNKIPDHPNSRFPHAVSQWVTVGEVLRCWKVPKSFLEMLARSPEGEPLLVPHPPGGDGMIFAQKSRTEMFKTVFTLSKKGQGAQLFDAIQEDWVYLKTFVLAYEEKNPRVLRAPGAVSISQARKREDDQPLLSDALEYQLTRAKKKGKPLTPRCKNQCRALLKILLERGYLLDEVPKADLKDIRQQFIERNKHLVWTEESAKGAWKVLSTNGIAGIVDKKKYQSR
jgi:hypothetical protein